MSVWVRLYSATGATEDALDPEMLQPRPLRFDSEAGANVECGLEDGCVVTVSIRPAGNVRSRGGDVSLSREALCISAIQVPGLTGSDLSWLVSTTETPAFDSWGSGSCGLCPEEIGLGEVHSGKCGSWSSMEML